MLHVAVWYSAVFFSEHVASSNLSLSSYCSALVKSCVKLDYTISDTIGVDAAVYCV